MTGLTAILGRDTQYQTPFVVVSSLPLNSKIPGFIEGDPLTPTLFHELYCRGISLHLTPSASVHRTLEGKFRVRYTSEGPDGLPKVLLDRGISRGVFGGTHYVSYFKILDYVRCPDTGYGLEVTH